MYLPIELVCPRHQNELTADKAGRVEEAHALHCATGCTLPMRDGIPRFVTGSSYASAFGLRWNRFRRTQLDSHTGTTIHDRLTRCLGASLQLLRGRSVLETK